MGKRTGKKPSVDDTYVWRICHALDMDLSTLAANLGVRHREVVEMAQVKSAAGLAEIERSEVWWRLNEFVTECMGSLMAVRYELNKQLQKDREIRVSRMARFQKYHKG